jgi:hypothetical protein
VNLIIPMRCRVGKGVEGFRGLGGHLAITGKVKATDYNELALNQAVQRFVWHASGFDLTRFYLAFFVIFNPFLAFPSLSF